MSLDLVANSRGQSLLKHLLGVAKRATQVLEELGLNETKFKQLLPLVYKAGLFHDLGKIDPHFQAYIKQKRKIDPSSQVTEDAEEQRSFSKTWHGVFHQELSWAIVRRCLRDDDQSGGVIRYAVYWHHPAAVNEQDQLARAKMGEIVSDYGFPLVNLLNDNEEFIKRLLDQADPQFVKPEDFSGTFEHDDVAVPEYYVTRSSGEKSMRIEGNANNTLVTAVLIEADRQISELSQLQLENYLAGDQLSFLVYEPFYIPECVIDNSQRSLEQDSLAFEAAQHTITVCGVDTGAGKTQISLRWKKAIKSERHLIYILPKRRLVDAMYLSIISDYTKMFGMIPDIQSAHSGKVQATTDESQAEPKAILSSKISVLVFDRLLSSFYRRGQFSEFAKMLKSDLVIDEFHEFKDVPKMIPSLRVILKIRSWFIAGARTILLSGTPDPALLRSLLGHPAAGSYHYIPRTKLTPVNPNLRTYKIDINPPGDLKNTIYSFNRIQEAQEFSKKRIDDSFIIHSRFRESDLKLKVRNLVQNFGKDSPSCEEVLVSSTMLQSSFDISRKNAVLTVAHPNTVAQYLGRIDRHGLHPDGVVFFKPEQKENIFRDDLAGYKSTYLHFLDHLRSLFASGERRLTHREATQLIWDEFFTNNDFFTTYFSELQKNIELAEKELNSEFPRKYACSKNSVHLSGSIFREESWILIAEIEDETGKSSGKMISVNDPVQISSAWIVRKLKNAISTLNATSLKVINEAGLSYTKYNQSVRIVGKSPKLPLIGSYINEAVNRKIVSGSGLKISYSEKLGLMINSAEDIDE